MSNWYADIRGKQFLQDAAQRIAAGSLFSGQPLQMQRDPTNEFDKNAIRLKTEEGIEVGWVSKEVAALVAPKLDRGIPLVAIVHTRNVVYIRAAK